MKIGHRIVKARKILLIVAILLLFPAFIGYKGTRINYDMLTYLPEDMETIQGQNVLRDDFHKGGFSIVVIENMKSDRVRQMKREIKSVDHVTEVVSLQDVLDPALPTDMLPDRIADNLTNEKATLLGVFFDTSTSDEKTLTAVEKIREIGEENTYVSGLFPMVLDLKNLCEEEEPKYVTVAVLLSLLAMMLLLDSYMAPLLFLLSIGMAIFYNLGTNIFFGEISYITKAIAAVLQLGVTMDYSIFLWHSYTERRDAGLDDEEAMALAIDDTLASVTGSSITTVAGFLALCFMTYTMGKDLGVVMAKGVVLGVLTSITILPALLLQCRKTLKKTMHRALIPDTHALSHGLTSRYMIYILGFMVLLVPAVYGYNRQNVVYDFTRMLSSTQNELPESKIKFLTANEKLYDDFNIATTYMVLTDEGLSAKDSRAMIDQIEELDGIGQVIGLSKLVGTAIPNDILPEGLSASFAAKGHQMIVVNSQYRVSTDQCNAQIDQVKQIAKTFDPQATVIGEGPATKDLIHLTDKDFQVVTWISIGLVFLIIVGVLRSLSLPFLLVGLIEFAILVNLAIPGYTGLELPFIVPICISTIQLGSTVDYAILMSTRYKKEREKGLAKRPAIIEAAAASIPSIIVSALGFFTATIGVAIYSNVGIISIMCRLMARGAIISMLTVILGLPSFLMLLDGLIVRTTKGMRGSIQKNTISDR